MTQGSTARAWALGGTILAATVMLIIGIFQIFLGIAAIVRNAFFLIGPNSNYAYRISTTSWGWIHLAIGVVAALTGLFLFTGAMWARAIGIALAVVSAVANFFFLPYYPLWSLLIIALDIFVIWAIANVGSRSDRQAMAGDAAMVGGRSRGDYQNEANDRWPSTNQTGGRQWTGEPARDDMSERERAEAMSRSGMGQSGSGQSGSGQSGMGQSGMGQSGSGQYRSGQYESGQYGGSGQSGSGMPAGMNPDDPRAQGR